MSKILRQNVGGVDFTMAGCALTGVCPTAAADYVKQITLSDGDVIEDGMMMVVTFANGNTAGNAPSTKTIYSSDQVNYFEDEQLTVPFTLAPNGCYEIEYTGTANAYTYTDYPVFQVGSVSGPVCDYRGHIASGDLWNSGDSVQCMLKEGKFLLLGGSGGADIDVYDSMADLLADLPNLQEGQFAATADTGDELSQPVDVVESGNLHAVSSNAVAEYINSETTIIESTVKRTVTLEAGKVNWYGADLPLPSIPENKRVIRYIPYVSYASTVAVMSGIYRAGSGIITPCIFCLADTDITCDIWWVAEVADK